MNHLVLKPGKLQAVRVIEIEMEFLGQLATESVVDVLALVDVAAGNRVVVTIGATPLDKRHLDTAEEQTRGSVLDPCERALGFHGHLMRITVHRSTPALWDHHGNAHHLQRATPPRQEPKDPRLQAEPLGWRRASRQATRAANPRSSGVVRPDTSRPDTRARNQHSRNSLGEQ